MSSVTLVCDGCGSEFKKRKAEVKRQRKKNPERKFYCSMSCYSNSEGKYNLGSRLGAGIPEKFLGRGRPTDEFSPFRYYMNKARNRKHATDLDLPYLKELWDSQEGRCALSGMEMTLPVNTTAFDRDKHNPWKASLDRIDCSKGYLKGNVRFVTSMANFCRQHSYTDQDVIKFARAVVGFHSEGAAY